MKHDILNYQGVKVGELELPDEMSSEEIAEKLSFYNKAPPVEAIPDVTPRQMRQALIRSGIALADVEAALDSLPEPTKSLAKVEWEYSVSFQRSRPLVAQMGAMLGWSSEQLDALWKYAATL